MSYFKPCIDFNKLVGPPLNFVVTEANTPIGRSIIRALHVEPDVLKVVGLAPTEAAVAELKQLFAGYKEAVFYVGDMNSASSANAAAANLKGNKIVPSYLFVVCANPNSISVVDKPADKVSDTEFETGLKNIVLAPRNSVAAIHPLMKSIDDSVIACFTSEWGLAGAAGKAERCVPRHALEGLLKCFAADYANSSETTFITVSPKRPDEEADQQIRRMCSGAMLAYKAAHSGKHLTF